MVRQGGEVGQSDLLEGGFILDGHLGQESGESQGQKLRHAEKNKIKWHEIQESSPVVLTTS